MEVMAEGLPLIFVGTLPLNGSAATLKKTAELAREEFADSDILNPEYNRRLNLEMHMIRALSPFEIGDYRVIAFPAVHDAQVEPLLYAVQHGAQTIFYGTDTSDLNEETWRGFHIHKLVFDLVVLDHTYGPGLAKPDHLGSRQFIQIIARLREERITTANARVLATHISHEGNPVHPELSEYARQHGYEIAFDGQIIDGFQLERGISVQPAG